jgi:hypothetical protein
MATAAPDLDELRRVVQLTAPVTLAREHTLPVLDELQPLLPEGGLRRGSTVTVRGAGSCALAISLTAEVSRTGGWVVGVGVPTLGLSAALEAGVTLERWAFIDDPGDQAAEVINALISGVDLIVVGPEVRLRLTHTRRLAARMRERGTTVVQIGTDPVASLSTDLTIEIERSSWTGVEWGHGRLRARRVEIATTGRGAAARSRRLAAWMPGLDGRISVIERARVERAQVDDPRVDPDAVIDLTRRAV